MEVLLYERDHAILLSNFINAHANDKAMVILVNPNRGYQSKFTKQMETFGFSFSFIEPKNTDFWKSLTKVKYLNIQESSRYKIMIKAKSFYLAGIEVFF